MIALATLIVAVACLYAQYAHYQFRRSERKHVDTVKLADSLEAELASMQELKHQMQGLMLKNSFGR